PAARATDLVVVEDLLAGQQDVEGLLLLVVLLVLVDDVLVVLVVFLVFVFFFVVLVDLDRLGLVDLVVGRRGVVLGQVVDLVDVVELCDLVVVGEIVDVSDVVELDVLTVVLGEVVVGEVFVGGHSHSPPRVVVAGLEADGRGNVSGL